MWHLFALTFLGSLLISVPSTSRALDYDADSAFAAQMYQDSLEYAAQITSEIRREERRAERELKRREKEIAKIEEMEERLMHQQERKLSQIYWLIFGLPIGIILLVVFIRVRKRREAAENFTPNIRQIRTPTDPTDEKQFRK